MVLKRQNRHTAGGRARNTQSRTLLCSSARPLCVLPPPPPSHCGSSSCRSLLAAIDPLLPPDGMQMYNIVYHCVIKHAMEELLVSLFRAVAGRSQRPTRLCRHVETPACSLLGWPGQDSTLHLLLSAVPLGSRQLKLTTMQMHSVPCWCSASWQPVGGALMDTGRQRD